MSFSKLAKKSVEKSQWDLFIDKIDTPLSPNVVGRTVVLSSVLLYGCCKIAYPLYKRVRRRKTDDYDLDDGNGYNSSSKNGDNNNGERVPNGNIGGKCAENASKTHSALRKKKSKRTAVAPVCGYILASTLPPGMNAEFANRLIRLMRIMVPGVRSHEAVLLCAQTAALITRTLLSVYVAGLEGRMVKFMVRRDTRQFVLMLLHWLAIALPATFINSLIRYLECKLSLAFRSRVVDYAYALYLGREQTYYRVSNMDGRIENADHRLTEDVTAFCTSVAHLYSHLTKPLLDCTLITFALARSSRQMGAAAVPGPLLAIAVIGVTGQILRMVSPKFGALVSVEAECKAHLRHIHSRIIANAEEIAFYNGHRVELSHLRCAYQSLVSQKNVIMVQKLWYVVLEQFLMKYVWSATGMVMVSLPIITGHTRDGQDVGISERTQYFTTARNLLLSGGDAVERLMSSYKEIVELAGYTERVGAMLDVFEEVSRGCYRKTITANSTGNLPISAGQLVVNGKIEWSTDGSIGLKNVPIVTPNGDLIVPNLTIKVIPGQHLLITGPNGCGKSSLFRVLSGLWPVYQGVLVKPPNCTMFYIPQRPYMTLGTLREQIIYPDTLEDMRRKGCDDVELERCLRRVSLRHLLERQHGWDASADWKDVLSGGEKQRMAIARIFYHKPSFALLDECTSAVSIDVESDMYQAAKDIGVTLLTITHRPSLWKFHTQILEFDGEGGWKISPLQNGVKLNAPNSEETQTK